jgi:hypothetical protein
MHVGAINPIETHTHKRVYCYYHSNEAQRTNTAPYYQTKELD